VLSNLTYASLYQLFVTGFFHGDPHPGNIIVQHDNRVGFVDFGIFGELNDYQRELLANYTASLALGHIGQCYRHIASIYFPTERSDEQSFARDVQDTLRAWCHASASYHASSKDRHIGGAFDAMVRIVYRHHYRASLGYLLFWRAIIVLDSVAIRLQPAFDLAHQARRFFERNRRDVFRLEAAGHDIPQLGSLLLNRIPFTSSSVFDATYRIERASSMRKRSSRRGSATSSVRAE
jgi:ubiquinone biosynthesis protein